MESRNPCYCKKPKVNEEGICKKCKGILIVKPKKATKKENNLVNQLEELKQENKFLKERFRKVELEGWKGMDDLIIEKFGAVWHVVEHRKDKLTGEVGTAIHKIPEQNVGIMWDIIQNKCNIGEGTTYRKIVPSIIETYHFPIEIEEFNGGRNRAKYYFPFYYYCLKILESLKFIRYGGRGKIVRLK